MLHRIPHGKGQSASPAGKPVYIQHGIMGSSAEWIILPSNQSLGAAHSMCWLCGLLYLFWQNSIYWSVSAGGFGLWRLARECTRESILGQSRLARSLERCDFLGLFVSVYWNWNTLKIWKPLVWLLKGLTRWASMTCQRSSITSCPLQNETNWFTLDIQWVRCRWIVFISFKLTKGFYVHQRYDNVLGCNGLSPWTEWQNRVHDCTRTCELFGKR